MSPLTADRCSAARNANRGCLPDSGQRAAGQRTRDPRAGLTLVEILVAVTLMGMLAVGMTTALSMGAGAWSDVRERLTLDRKIASSNQLLHAHFAAVTPITAQSPNARVGAYPFFHGDPQEMRFVSSYSTTGGVRGGLRIVELNVMSGSGGKRLVLTESPYRGPLSVGRFITGAQPTQRGLRLTFSPVRPRKDSLIVADQLAEVSFAYRGEMLSPLQPPEWTSSWNDAQRMPIAIRVQMKPARREARLQPVSITGEVRTRFARPGAGGGGQFFDPRTMEIITLPNGEQAIRLK